MARKKAEPKTAPIEKPAEKQQSFIEGQDYYMDPDGQMTISNIDTPLGLLCQELINLENKVEELQEKFQEQCVIVMEEMQKSALLKIKVLGRVVVYKEAQLSEPKILLKDSMAA